MFRTVGKFVLNHVKFLKKNEYFWAIQNPTEYGKWSFLGM